jgi:exopolysaccharide biosynthesis protein
MHRAEVKTLCRLAKASVCINANFFDEAGDPLGVVMSRGIVHHKIHGSGRTLTGIIQSTRQGISIIPRQAFTGAAVLDAVQAGPRLVVDGVRSKDITDLTRTGRSAVCLDQQGRLILVASSAGFRGLTFSELQDLLLDENVGCKTALNLDGGGSAQLFVSPTTGGKPNSAEAISLNGFDQVPVALALFNDKE